MGKQKKNNGGAIPSNLLQISNSESNSKYLAICKALGVKAHPARFPHKLPEFFVKMLTEEGDNVVDIFGGSCTTGEVCEGLKRNWKCFELDRSYIAASAFRFISKDEETAKEIYNTIYSGGTIEGTLDAPINIEIPQKRLTISKPTLLFTN